MKRNILFLLALLFTANAFSQNHENLIGEYSVTEIVTGIDAQASGYKDTLYYKITIVNKANDTVSMLDFGVVDTVDVIIKNDSINIFEQTYYDSKGEIIWVIQGKGKFYSDSVVYTYHAGGPNGTFDCKCVAKKVKINAIYNLEQNKRFLICYPNPFSNNIDVDVDIPQNINSAELRIYDVNGIIVKRITVSNRGKGCQNIDFSSLNGGVYSCVLLFDGMIKYNTKIVKY